jgi:hypothetical protein
MLEDYLNFDHGLELYPGNTEGIRGNENGILYFAEYLILHQMVYGGLQLKEYWSAIDIISSLQVEPGLYDRGVRDKYRENPKRTISQDNLHGISSIARSFSEDIANYGLKHFFVFNNNQKGFALPMNPGNYSIWLAHAGKFFALQLLFLPFFLINYIISMSKPRENTSSKILYLVKLYPLTNEKIYGTIYKNYLKRLEKQYGAKYFEELFKIYFKDENHPINVLARQLYAIN